MTQLQIGELFAGYGGLGMAVQQATGGRLAWLAEYDAAPSKVLAHRFPDVPNLGDITRVDWRDVPRVDVLSGGSPCQDLSTAGARRGMAPGTRSNLWAVMRECIAVHRPRLVVWENVRGAFTAAASSAMEPGRRLLGPPRGQPALRALGRVLGDLSELGYDARWHGLPASDVGAPHERYRVFLAAYPSDNPPDAQPGCLGGQPGAQQRPWPADHGSDVRSRPVSAPGPAGSEVDPGWGPVRPAIERWQAVTGHTAPRLADPYPVIAEWMMGLPRGWVTDLGLAEGAAMKVLGNGVVPQQALHALRVMGVAA